MHFVSFRPVDAIPCSTCVTTCSDTCEFRQSALLVCPERQHARERCPVETSEVARGTGRCARTREEGPRLWRESARKKREACAHLSRSPFRIPCRAAVTRAPKRNRPRGPDQFGNQRVLQKRGNPVDVKVAMGDTVGTPLRKVCESGLRRRMPTGFISGMPGLKF